MTELIQENNEAAEHKMIRIMTIMLFKIYVDKIFIRDFFFSPLIWACGSSSIDREYLWSSSKPLADSSARSRNVNTC